MALSTAIPRPITSVFVRSRHFNISSQELSTTTVYDPHNVRYQPSVKSHARACFDEYQNPSKPLVDMGLPGDIWVDTTPDSLSLHSRMHDGQGWALWAGLDEESMLEHPVIKDRFLWLTTQMEFQWVPRDYVSKRPKLPLSASSVVAHVLWKRKKQGKLSLYSGAKVPSSDQESPTVIPSDVQRRSSYTESPHDNKSPVPALSGLS